MSVTPAGTGFPAPRRSPRRGIRRVGSVVAGVAVLFGAFSVVLVPQATAQPATSTTTLTAEPPSPTFGDPVTMTATVTCAGAQPGGTVDFTTEGGSLGDAMLQPADPDTATASLTVYGLAPGSHSITAYYGGDASCAASTSDLVVVTVAAEESGPVTGSVDITEPTTLLPGTIVLGSVNISGEGALNAEGARIIGAVTATGGVGLRLCESTVLGRLSVSGMDGVVQIGDTDAGIPCEGNNIFGRAGFTDNTGYLELDDNRVLGSVTLTGNTTTISVPPDNPDATEVAANTIFGSLGCTGNTPPPTNSGEPNTVYGSSTGQCAEL
ncbi:hypothetical protein SacmaDRAFT_1810 [Saccharomonospora marina XMU15]|uniref:Bacterial Ig-like domain-containing protein n=1 Tax=Saccharomonospora marina XMU15 TaxID=882083 RepID=H5X5K7_9PSEU|nr:Ig-like domain-containing protein [Saccharomonospora marina]EHR50079.1 hypothetical protein SacmaDRAFT_1810 [Saccharomonospora marina XMU15]